MSDPLRPKLFAYKLGDVTQDLVKKEKKSASSAEINYFTFELQARQLIEKLLSPLVD